MLLTITTTHIPATDLGYLLMKHPANCHTKQVSTGSVHCFFPEATDLRCTVAVLLEVDPISLVRGHRDKTESGPLAQYVNDRPYVASSMMSVAISKLFNTAMSGTSRERQELVTVDLPFEVTIATLPCRGGDSVVRNLFEPLGYTVTTQRHILDDQFPEWGDSSYYTVKLIGNVCLRSLLKHLYVLMPVLDDEKHYFVGDDEVAKLLRHGEGWLADHPAKELIANRYLKHRKVLVNDTLQQLLEEEQPDEEEHTEQLAKQEDALEERVSLNDQRLSAVVDALKQRNAQRVLDLGCGEGRLTRCLLADKQFIEILAMDVSCRSLERAKDRLHLDKMPEFQRKRLNLVQGSLMYRDDRIAGHDAAAVVEVIEHMDSSRLTAFERGVFEYARPNTVVVTTPNREYNTKWETLPAGQFRHRDHRFEWTREEFGTWANGIADRYKYTVEYRPIGDLDEIVGSPTQMAIFERLQ